MDRHVVLVFRMIWGFYRAVGRWVMGSNRANVYVDNSDRSIEISGSHVVDSTIGHRESSTWQKWQSPGRLNGILFRGAVAFVGCVVLPLSCIQGSLQPRSTGTVPRASTTIPNELAQVDPTPKVEAAARPTLGAAVAAQPAQTGCWFSLLATHNVGSSVTELTVDSLTAQGLNAHALPSSNLRGFSEFDLFTDGRISILIVSPSRAEIGEMRTAAVALGLPPVPRDAPQHAPAAHSICTAAP